MAWRCERLNQPVTFPLLAALARRCVSRDGFKRLVEALEVVVAITGEGFANYSKDNLMAFKPFRRVLNVVQVDGCLSRFRLLREAEYSWHSAGRSLFYLPLCKLQDQSRTAIALRIRDRKYLTAVFKGFNHPLVCTCQLADVHSLTVSVHESSHYKSSIAYASKLCRSLSGQPISLVYMSSLFESIFYLTRSRLHLSPDVAFPHPSFRIICGRTA